MHIRPITSDDLSIIDDLLRVCDEDPRVDLAMLSYNTFEDPTFDAELSLLAEEQGEAIGFCLGACSDEEGEVRLFAVHPAHRHKDMATRLFDELEGRLRARGAASMRIEAKGGTRYYWPGVDLCHTDAICFLFDRGYQSNRTVRIDMDVDLATANLDYEPALQRLASEGIALRRLSPDELDWFGAFVMEVFGAGWHEQATRAIRHQPTPLFVAIDTNDPQQQRIVGFAVYDVVGQRRFGPTGVHPDWRKRGIGAALLRMCLASMRERGDAVAEIGWTGPLSFYARAVGARLGHAYWGFTKSLVPKE